MPVRSEDQNAVYSRIAAVDIVEGVGVVLDANDKFALAGDGVECDGVSITSVTAGTKVSATYDGFPLVKLGGAVNAIGTELTPKADGTGTFVAAVAGKKVVCIARQTGASGEKIRVKWLRRAQYTKL